MTYKFNASDMKAALAEDPHVSVTLTTLICLIALFGLVGNVAQLRIYFKKDRKIRFNNLMLLIAIFDLLYLLFKLNSLIIEKSQMLVPLWYRLLYGFVINWSFSGSAYTMALIAIERYLAICKDR